MKKQLVLFLACILAFSVYAVPDAGPAVKDTAAMVTQSVSTVPEISGPIEQTIIQSIQEGFLNFLRMVNWLFVVVFIILAWLINDTAESTNKYTTWLNWWSAIPKAFRTLIAGFILIAIFAWAFDYNTKQEITEMLFGIIVSMVIYKIGIKQFLTWVSQRLGFKFENTEKIPEKPEPNI